MIDCFDGNYSFLSNFYEAPVVYKDLLYQNSEAAFQAQKCPGRAQEFCVLPPGKAKRLGRKVELRIDWDLVKNAVMYDVVKAKFTQNPDLRKKLLDTGYEELVEGNYWNDKYWGVCNSEGLNMLGKILMVIREELRNV